MRTPSASDCSRSSPTAHRPRWLGGIGADVAGYVFEALALGAGTLVLVEPILGTALVFSLLFGSLLHGRRFKVSSTSRRYSPEFKERAVRMVRELRRETGQKHGTIQRVAEQAGCGVESLRTWTQHADIDAGEQPGVSSAEAKRVKALEQEVRELRRANTILKSASAFFAAELDRPQK